MKLYVTSDIHLEYGDCVIENKDNADVLILGGDIMLDRGVRISVMDFSPRFKTFRRISIDLVSRTKTSNSSNFRSVVFVGVSIRGNDLPIV